ncbi:MAG: hypothetical protein CMB99_16580 [Flavobacteriaceae bacterium]|nr:hypothetical protein [Flavobacteriaceae bacterium]
MFMGLSLQASSDLVRHPDRGTDPRKTITFIDIELVDRTVAEVLADLPDLDATVLVNTFHGIVSFANGETLARNSLRVVNGRKQKGQPRWTGPLRNEASVAGALSLRIL